MRRNNVLATLQEMAGPLQRSQEQYATAVSALASTIYFGGRIYPFQLRAIRDAADALHRASHDLCDEVERALEWNEGDDRVIDHR